MTISLVHLCQQAARGKRQNAKVAAFLLDQDRRLWNLNEAIQAESYRPGYGSSFFIRDPKPRWIYALPFADRIVQHLLISQTLPAIEKAASPHSYACRKGKGTHRALSRAAKLCRHRKYVLRLDIRKFFASIDHEILRRQLLRFTPPSWRWLQNAFLDAETVVEQVHFHFPGDNLLTPFLRPHGLPIGSLTSQIWANVYLSPLDHALSSYLGLPDFVRYCDDILIFSEDRQKLRQALPKIVALLQTLRLRLHPMKTRLHKTSDPVPFLGFVLRRRNQGVQIRLKADNVVRMRRRMAQVKALFAAGAIDIDEVRGHIHSWLAHARHGHTRELLKKELARLSFQRKEDG